MSFEPIGLVPAKHLSPFLICNQRWFSFSFYLYRNRLYTPHIGGECVCAALWLFFILLVTGYMRIGIFVHLTRLARPRSVYGAASGWFCHTTGMQKTLLGHPRDARGSENGKPFGAVIKHANCIRVNCQVNGKPLPTSPNWSICLSNSIRAKGFTPSPHPGSGGKRCKKSVLSQCS